MKNEPGCGVCAAVRAHLASHLFFYIPWAVLVAGGIAAALPSPNPSWERGSAYLIAGALLWFVVSSVYKSMNHLRY